MCRLWLHPGCICGCDPGLLAGISQRVIACPAARQARAAKLVDPSFLYMVVHSGMVALHLALELAAPCVVLDRRAACLPRGDYVCAPCNVGSQLAAGL